MRVKGVHDHWRYEVTSDGDWWGVLRNRKQALDGTDNDELST